MDDQELQARVRDALEEIRDSARKEYDHAVEEPTSMPPMIDGEVDQQWVNDLPEMEFALYVMGRHDGLKQAAQDVEEALDGGGE